MKPARMTLQSRRSGFSRVTVIIVLCLAALLLAILAPAVISAREQARKLQCLSSMSEVSMAMQNFVVLKDGRLPLLTDDVDISNGDGQQGIMHLNWAIPLLHALDLSELFIDINKNAVVVPGETMPKLITISQSERIWLPVFTCPDDADSFRKPGGLSFVVNGGFISRSLYPGDPDELHRPGMMSWNGNNIVNEDADINIGAATGVFWRKNGSFQSSLDYISRGDGQSMTMMMTENLQAGSWYDTDTAKIAFLLPVTVNDGQVLFGEENIFESIERPLNTMFTGGTLAAAMPKDWQVNSELNAKTGSRPRPSSNHKGGVNCIMCDGSRRFLSDQIDPHVYVKLLTSNGMNCGETELLRSSY